MQKIKMFTRILTLFLISLTLINCSNDNESITETNAKVQKLEFLKIDLSTKNSVKNLSTEQYLDYVLFDGVPSKIFMEKNNVDTESFISYLTETIETMDARYTYNLNSTSKAELSLEEIRDAMINECENGYCCGLDDACSIAVKAAYHIKKFQE